MATTFTITVSGVWNTAGNKLAKIAEIAKALSDLGLDVTNLSIEAKEQNRAAVENEEPPEANSDDTPPKGDLSETEGFKMAVAAFKQYIVDTFGPINTKQQSELLGMNGRLDVTKFTAGLELNDARFLRIIIGLRKIGAPRELIAMINGLMTAPLPATDYECLESPARVTQITLAGGTRLAGTEVWLQSREGKTIGPALASRGGLTVFADIPIGTYDIIVRDTKVGEISAPGKVTVDTSKLPPKRATGQSAITLRGNGNKANRRVMLRHIDSDTNTPLVVTNKVGMAIFDNSPIGACDVIIDGKNCGRFNAPGNYTANF